MTAKRKILQNNERKNKNHLKYRGIKQNSYILNSAVFFLVRKFYMLRRLLGALYVDMRRFGVSWLFSKHKILHNVINSTERSDIHVFNCYLCHVRFLLTCYVCSIKIAEISDISKCFENFVFQTHGVLTRIYAAELRFILEIFIIVIIKTRQSFCHSDYLC